MQKLILLALAITASLAAYPSEKGGNRVNRSHELQISLEFFKATNMCAPPYETKVSKKEICNELEQEIMDASGDYLGEEFFSQCCDK